MVVGGCFWFYTEDYTASLTGRQYSFNLPRKIGTNGNDEQLFLFLLPDHVYTIFLHDPDYFVYNANPVALPTLMRKFDTRSSVSQYYRLALTEVNELDLPADPCNTDPDNRFHACIRRNISGQVSFQEKSGFTQKFFRWVVELRGTRGATKTSQFAQHRHNTGRTFLLESLLSICS